MRNNLLLNLTPDNIRVIYRYIYRVLCPQMLTELVKRNIMAFLDMNFKGTHRQLTMCCTHHILQAPVFLPVHSSSIIILPAITRRLSNIFMNLLMTSKMDRLAKQFSTVTAFVRLFAAMHQFVHFKLTDLSESFRALLAIVRPSTGVVTFVRAEVTWFKEALSAMRTLVRLVARMNSLVGAHVASSRERFRAEGAFELFYALMDDA